MDLAKVKLHVDPGCTYGGIPTYLLISGSKKLLVTGPVLKSKREDLYKAVRAADPPVDTGIVLIDEDAFPLVKGGYAKTVRQKRVVRKLPKDSTRVYRVHPNRLSEKQREKMAGPGEGGRYRAEFVEEGLTSEERKHRAQEVAALRSAEWSRKEHAKRKSRRGETSAASAINPSATMGVKETAQKAGIEPVELRRFLRLKKIGKRGGRYYFTPREAEKIAKAARKYYA